MGMEDVWVIVPVYNEAEALAGVLADLRRQFPHILCVDDGSTDGSAAIARACGARVVRHAINRGQGAALQTGFDFLLRCTNVRFCVTFDADGQHLVSDAARMVACARARNLDVVLASRFHGSTQGMPTARGLVLRAAVHFTRWGSRLKVSDTHNGLRVLSLRALEKIRLELPRMAYASELLNAIVPNGLTYTEVPVSVIYTDYSKAKGQRNINSVNILFDLALRRLRATS
jgi:glycosyltransferase involved in cell wall biosynthesis